ncbi:MAG: SMP-30/gluconolactonase/LRE family protein [Propionibacteriaceae bacterium]|nr:SMP-30/gluconolactonase/LRE family protein [Propionibacteriaceae bacterium]
MNNDLRVVAEGFRLACAPIWDPPSGRLIFADLIRSTVYAYDERRGATVFRLPAQLTAGQVLDPQGRLIRCEQETAQVVRDEDDASVTVLASHYGGKRLNGPHDIALGASGVIWFTDHPLVTAEDQELTQPLGLYRLDPSTGDLARLYEGGFTGLALSSDEATLYANRSGEIMRLDPQGGPSPQPIAVLPQAGGVFGGIALSASGRLYVGTAQGVSILDQSGNPIATIALPEPVTNLTWGNDHQTLYITTFTAIYAFDVPVAK